MSNMAQEFRKRLIRFSGDEITGRILVKISGGNIVYLENIEKVLLPGPAEKNVDIPIAKCVNIVGGLMAENFFGDVIFDTRAGRIVWVGVMKIYKPDEIDDYFPERRNK